MYVQVALFGAKHWKELILILMLIFTLIFMCFFGLQQEEEAPPYDGGGTAKVSPLVLRYEPLVTKYAKKYGVEQYVQLLLAKMMQETGGRLPDVMQSSESLGLPPNSIIDPEQSIDVGVKYYSKLIKKTKGDIKLALQSYNFGGGFIDYANKRGGYSKEVAVEFSRMMAVKMGWDSYGDVDYVDHVLRYLDGGGPTLPVNSYGFVLPLEGPWTSPFGYRINPVGGYEEVHTGQDIGCQQQAKPIRAAKTGTVVNAGWNNQGYGNRVTISHGGNQQTLYAHLSQVLVKPGQKINQGQIIGKCGATGNAKGLHLHFEIRINGKPIDPAPYLK